MSHYYMKGLTVLGAPIVGAETVPVFTDKDTVRYVQQALAALPAAAQDPVLQIKADGVIGPATKAAINKFNTQYRGSSDGSDITQGTLDALHLNPAGAPSGYRAATPLKISASAAASPIDAHDSAGGGGVIDYLKSLPTWQLVLGGVGVLAVGYATYRLVATSGVRDRRASALARLAA